MNVSVVVCLVAAALLGWLAHGPAHAAPAEFFVSPTGSDAAAGTRAAPFATLERARDAVRALRARGGRPRPVVVNCRGGVYLRAASFELEAQDGGAPAAPVVYRAYGRETVRLVGGRPVDNWQPVTDPVALARLPDEARGRVLQADLRATGITDFGTLRRRGFGLPGDIAAGAELFHRGEAMPLARWPNAGWDRIQAAPDGPQGGRFTTRSDRVSRWVAAPDAWVHGYWGFDWADTHEKVAAIDPARREIRTDPPHGVYGYKPGQRWYAYNLLEELDDPGEWYLDRQAGRAYWWPPAAPAAGEVTLSLLEQPVISVKGASNIRLERLTVECTRGEGINVRGAANVVVAGCTVRGTGTAGISFVDCRKSGALSCDVHHTGDGAIVLSGGDRKSLQPGELFARNCHIHHQSRWDRTYRPGVLVEGVGNVVANCRIHDAPHNAVLLGGNNHVIELNEIYRVCTDTGDAGAFYMGRDFTMRGNVIRHNIFRDIRRSVAESGGFVDVMAVYLDDCASGTTVFGNLFVRAGRAAMIGGGRDNTIENNIFVDCAPSVHVDQRAKGWAAQYFVPNGGWSIFEKLADMKHDQPPYSTAYPELARILAEDPAAARGNRIARNISVGGRWIDLLDGLDGKTVHIVDNVLDTEPRFRDAARGDYRLLPGSPALKLGFRQLPFARIGLQKDTYRRALPPKEHAS